MGHGHTTIEITDDMVIADEPIAKVAKIAYISGVIGMIAAVGLGALKASEGDHWLHFFHSYLTSYSYFLSIGLGALFFVILQHLARSGWSVTIRRLMEYFMSSFPMLTLLALPIVGATALGYHYLYEWTDPAIVAKDALIQHKEPYLNLNFFLIRMVIYFTSWLVISSVMLKRSLAQDETGDPAITSSLERIAPMSIVVFSLTMTFAAVDFIMTLEPHWFSTIIGVYYFAGCFLSCLSTTVIVAMALQSIGKLEGLINQEHYHDIGKFMFAFTFFWGYIAFSQFMLYWYADIPEETGWYLVRQSKTWVGWALLLIVTHFFLPFPGLLSRHVKRNRAALRFWAFWILGAHYVDQYYLVMPTLTSIHKIKEFPLGLLDLACFVGIGGLVVGFVANKMRGKRLVAIRDPRLPECLAHENQ